MERLVGAVFPLNRLNQSRRSRLRFKLVIAGKEALFRFGNGFCLNDSSLDRAIDFDALASEGFGFFFGIGVEGQEFSLFYQYRVSASLSGSRQYTCCSPR
jgi:hypothetical protein